MSKKIFCEKLQKEADALTSQPYPGELGQRIMQNISQEAWNAWLGHQTMLINEYRLNLMDAKSRTFLEEEMEKYFFGQGSNKPEGYVDPEIDSGSTNSDKE